MARRRHMRVNTPPPGTCIYKPPPVDWGWRQRPGLGDMLRYREGCKPGRAHRQQREESVGVMMEAPARRLWMEPSIVERKPWPKRGREQLCDPDSFKRFIPQRPGLYAVPLNGSMEPIGVVYLSDRKDWDRPKAVLASVLRSGAYGAALVLSAPDRTVPQREVDRQAEFLLETEGALARFQTRLVDYVILDKTRSGSLKDEIDAMRRHVAAGRADALRRIMGLD